MSGYMRTIVVEQPYTYTVTQTDGSQSTETGVRQVTRQEWVDTPDDAPAPEDQTWNFDSFEAAEDAFTSPLGETTLVSDEVLAWNDDGDGVVQADELGEAAEVEGLNAPSGDARVDSVVAVDLTPNADGRVSVDDYFELGAALENGQLTNLDVRFDVNLDMLRFKSPEETYGEYAQRLQDDYPEIAQENPELVEAMLTYPDADWQHGFAGEDISGTVFHGDVTGGISFEQSHGTDVVFQGRCVGCNFQSAVIPGAQFLGGLERSSLIGADLRDGVIQGEVNRVAGNVSILDGADLSGVTAFVDSDFAFASMDGTTLPGNMASINSGSVFTGTGATPGVDEVIPSVELDSEAIVAALEDAGHDVETLRTEGGLLPALLALDDEVFDPAWLDGLLPPSWRSVVATGLGDGQPIKPTVYDAVDGRYGAYDRAEPPTLRYLYENYTYTQPLIDRVLGNLLLDGPDTTTDLADPTGLQGSAVGTDGVDEWLESVTSRTVEWPGPDGAPGSGEFAWSDQTIADFTVARPVITELYLQLESNPAAAEELARLRELDAGRGFSLADLAADPEAYPLALQFLYEYAGGER